MAFQKFKRLRKAFIINFEIGDTYLKFTVCVCYIYHSLVWSKCCHFKKQGIILYVVSPIKFLMVNLLRCPWTFIKDSVSYTYHRIFCRALNCLSKGIVIRIYFQYLVLFHHNIHLTFYDVLDILINIKLRPKYRMGNINLSFIMCVTRSRTLMCITRLSREENKK